MNPGLVVSRDILLAVEQPRVLRAATVTLTLSRALEVGHLVKNKFMLPKNLKSKGNLK